MGHIVPIIVLARQKQYLKGLHSSGATSAETARTLEDLSLRDSGLLRALVRRGVVRTVQGNRYYVDVDAEQRMLSTRRKTLAALLALFGLGFVLLYFLT